VNFPSKTYWDNVGSDWDLIGPPLRPCPEDSAIMEQLVDRWVRKAQAAVSQAVILGVTQEIVGMRWPEKTHILAFDREPARIKSLWPRHLPNAAALCSNWLELPLVDGYADLVLADGSFTLLKFPGEYRDLSKELARILSPGGIVVVRLYVAPDSKESVDDIFKDLWGGKISNFNTFKWRLAMALLDPSDYSSSFNEVWEAWHARMSSPEKLAETLGWPLPVIRMIERYRGCVSTRNSYPPLDKIRQALAPLFIQEDIVIPSYQDGERYPTVCFRKT
jgi:hypothetical protein